VSDIDALAESARNRGLKLVRSRVRSPAKRRFGKVGLKDSAGKAVFGMDAKGPTAKPDDVEDYLRNLGASDWGASLDQPVRPRKSKPTPKKAVVAKPETAAKPKPPPKPQLRDAKPADASRLAELIRELGHEIDEKSIRRNLAALKKAGEPPFVATLDKALVGLCGVHRMVVVHRDKPVGRVTILIVTEAAQGRKIGRMLIEEAERRLRQAGCGRVEITVGDRRARAQGFYRHMGYERSSIRFWKTL
jgi:GNAT superfamily N-acetyltransferase